MPFICAGIESTAEAYAPTPMKPTWANDRMQELPMNTCSPTTRVRLMQRLIAIRSSTRTPSCSTPSTRSPTGRSKSARESQILRSSIGRASGPLARGRAAHQPFRAPQQDQDHQAEGERVPKLEEVLRQGVVEPGVDERQDEAAEHRTLQAAHAADHRGDERDQERLEADP